MEKTEKKNNDGLHLDKKTVLGILAILLAVYIFAGVLTQVMPRGEYNTFPDPETGKPAITTESVYTELPDYRVPIWKIVAAPVLVFIDKDMQDTGFTGLLIIAFIVLMGGTFLLLDKCGVLRFLVAVVIKKFSRRKYLLMAVLVFSLMLLSSMAGVMEESVTLVPIAVAISLALGWDSLVGLGMSLVSIAFGFTAATFNPFNVMTVQRLAGDVEIYSGLWLRIIVFVLVYLGLFMFLFTYAKRIEKDPSKSFTYDSDAALREKYSVDDIDSIFADKKTAQAGTVFLICMGLAIVGIIVDFAAGAGGNLSMASIAFFFVFGALIAAVIKGLTGKRLAKAFFSGVKTVAPAIPLILLVISVAYILNAGKIMHTILYYVYNLIKEVNPYAAILLIFVFIAILEFFIGSGTAKAFLVMPLVIPLAHLIGISSNSVVLAFCLADGFTNLLYPTSGLIIIAIGLIGVSYTKWLKFSWPLFLIEGIISVSVMLFAVGIGYC